MVSFCYSGAVVFIFLVKWIDYLLLLTEIWQTWRQKIKEQDKKTKPRATGVEADLKGSDEKEDMDAIEKPAQVRDGPGHPGSGGKKQDGDQMEVTVKEVASQSSA
jgi:hypothetical protein